MNEYLFYTIEGYTFSPMEDCEVKNCQLLGRAKGENAKEAKNNLMKENPWIIELGFNADSIFSEQILTAEQRSDIMALGEYIKSHKNKSAEVCDFFNEQMDVVVKRLVSTISGGCLA